MCRKSAKPKTQLSGEVSTCDAQYTKTPIRNAHLSPRVLILSTLPNPTYPETAEVHFQSQASKSPSPTRLDQTPTNSKTKQPTPPLPKRINNQSAQKQPDRDPNRNLNHGITNVEDHAVDIRVGPSLRPVADGRRPRGIASDLVGGSDATDQGAAGGQAGGDLDEDGGEESSGRDAMLEARVEVAENADGKGAEGISDLGVGREAFGGKVVDDVAGKGDDEHDGGLAPFRLVDDDQTHGEWGHEYEGIVRWKRSGAGRCGCCVLVHEAVDRRAYSDAEAEEEGVDDCVDHSYRTRDDGPRLEFQGAAYWVSLVIYR